LPLSFRAEKKNSHPKEPKGVAQKSPSKSLFSPANGPGKRKLKRNSSDSNHCFPAKYYRKKRSSTSTHTNKSQVGSLDFQPCQAITKYFKEPHQGSFKEGQVGKHDFHPCLALWVLSMHRDTLRLYQRGLTRESGHSNALAVMRPPTQWCQW